MTLPFAAYSAKLSKQSHCTGLSVVTVAAISVRLVNFALLLVMLLLVWGAGFRKSFGWPSVLILEGVDTFGIDYILW